MCLGKIDSQVNSPKQINFVELSNYRIFISILSIVKDEKETVTETPGDHIKKGENDILSFSLLLLYENIDFHPTGDCVTSDQNTPLCSQ